MALSPSSARHPQTAPFPTPSRGRRGVQPPLRLLTLPGANVAPLSSPRTWGPGRGTAGSSEPGLPWRSVCASAAAGAGCQCPGGEPHSRPPRRRVLFPFRLLLYSERFEPEGRALSSTAGTARPGGPQMPSGLLRAAVRQDGGCRDGESGRRP